MTARTARGAGKPDSGRLAELAGRLTSRDRALLRLLADHQVLTAEHAAALLGGSQAALSHRLVELTRLQVVERFRPLATVGAGSAPYHYVLGQAGSVVLAAEHGINPSSLDHRHDQAVAIAHDPAALAHQLGINSFFAALAATARTQPGAELVCVWPAARCPRLWGHVVRPDAYGRWRDPLGEADFFLEHDPGDQLLAARLAGYHDLALGSGIATPVLIWLSTTDRETSLRHTLQSAPGELLVPLATATRARGGPAGPVWLPLGQPGPRRPLAALGHPDAW